MTDTSPQSVRDYLSRLNSALADVQPEVRAEIMAGIREELDGLDVESAIERIDNLGDPSFIAAEARAAMPVAGTGGPLVGQLPTPSGRAFSLVAALVLIIGTFVIPFVGPFVGLLLVSFSTAWSRREKLIAWLAPVAVAIVVGVVPVVTSMVQQDASTSDAINPVLSFMGLTGWHLAILAYCVLPIVGVVLLVRANRRGWKR